MAIPPPSIEGTVAFDAWKTWFRVSGSLSWPKPPLVILHGGPGAAHNYTLRIARVAEQGRAVIHYDQLGIGRSSHLPDQDPGFWTVELFRRELDNLVNTLGLRSGYHVLGQSWGGMLGAEHAVRHPEGLLSLTIANSPASIKLWLDAANELRSRLPDDVQETLLRHEQDGTTQDPEYKAAERVFYSRHVCRLVPNPQEVLDSDAATEADPTVYHTMNGPNEFHVVGTMQDWTIVDRVPAIEVPTLLINGRYDEATDATMQPFADGIPNVRWERFSNSSHMPHVEEEERYLQVVGSFLDEHDKEK